MASHVLIFAAAHPLLATMGQGALAASVLALLVLARPTLPKLGAPLIYLLVFVAVPLVWGAAQILPIWQQWAHPMYGSMAPLANLTPAPISLHPQAFFPTLATALTAGIVFLGAYALGTTHPTRVLTGLAAIGALGAAYAVVAYLLGNDHVLWLPKVDYMDDLTGSFINRNHFATFMGLTMLLALAVWLQRVTEVPSANRADARTRLKAIMVLVLKPRWVWLVVLVIAAMALMLSHSRAGLVVSAVGLFMLTGLLAAQVRGARPLLITLLGGLILGGSILIGVMGQGVGSRLANLNTETSTRALINTTTQTIIAQNPYLGSGVGAFEDTFRPYHPEALSQANSRIDYAHNTWLEWASDLGLPAFTGLLAAVLLLVYIHFHGLRTRRRGVLYPALGLATLGLVGGHALVDFSAQLPGMAAFIAAILGLTTAQSLAKSNTEVTTSHTTTIMLAILASATLALSIWQFRPLVAMWPHSGTIRAVMAGQGAPLPQLQSAHAALTHAITMQPTAQRYQQRATIRRAIAQRVAQSALFNILARQDLVASLRLAPSNPFNWHQLARLYAAQGALPQATQALANSILTGPHLPPLVYARMPLIRSLWPHLSPEDRQLMCTSIVTGWQLSRQRTARALVSQTIGAYCLSTTPPTTLTRAGLDPTQ